MSDKKILTAIPDIYALSMMPGYIPAARTKPYRPRQRTQTKEESLAVLAKAQAKRDRRKIKRLKERHSMDHEQ